MTLSFARRPKSSAMTLVEVVTAMGVMTIMIAGVLAAFMQTRRLAAASVAQNCALTIVQGYIEQLKNMPLQQFVNSNPVDTLNNPNLTVSFSLPTMKDQTDVTVELRTTPSTVTTATLTGATPGTTPTGVYDNLETFDMDSRSGAGTTTWATAWPGANTSLVAYPTTIPGKTDLRMNFWVQITDLTPTASSRCKAYGMLIVYSWQYMDGNRVKYVTDSVRAIRSAVQTF
jgi:type II secretory pathway pseudopilin PulG